MKTEQKQILLKDLCERLPYGVYVKIEASLETGKDGYEGPLEAIDLGYNMFNGYSVMPESVKPYLRPMSSMTEEEKKRLNIILEYQYCSDDSCMCEASDWLNEHHFDYRGLIPMGLALEAPEGMYNF